MTLKKNVKSFIACAAGILRSVVSARFVLALSLTLLCSLTVRATEYVTDVMLIGGGSSAELDSLKLAYTDQDWTAVNYDLNGGISWGGNVQGILLLYKTTSSTGSSGTPITDFYLQNKLASVTPDTLMHFGRAYALAPNAGNIRFTGQKGDLNAGTGSETDAIHLFYTKETFADNRAVTAITFDSNPSNSLGREGDLAGGYDLNAGCSALTSRQIYMHLTTAENIIPNCFFTDVMLIGEKTKEKVNELIDTCIVHGWKVIGYDINRGLSGNADWIYLLYKQTISPDGLNHGYITDFYIQNKFSHETTMPITYDGRNYYLVPYYGSTDFMDQQGDLNSGTGSDSDPIHLFYTKERFISTGNTITGICINDIQSGAVGKEGGSTGYDLNAGCNTNKHIYLHVTTASTWKGLKPISKLEACKKNFGSILVKGWAYDPDESSESIPIRVEIKNTDGSDYMMAYLTASKLREDVNSTFNITGAHGFNTIIPIGTGSYSVSVYACDITGNGDVQVGRTKDLAIVDPFTEYNLWLGDKMVTYANEGDIYNELDSIGKISAGYDKVNNVLYVNKPRIFSAHTFGKDNATAVICSYDDSLVIYGEYDQVMCDAQYGVAARELQLEGDFSLRGTEAAIKCDTLSFYNGTLTLHGGVMAVDAANIILGENVYINKPDGGILKDGQFYESDGITIAKEVVLATRYNIWVSNTLVTSLNRDDILNDGGKAKFTPATNTLTLNNPRITQYLTDVNGITVSIYARDRDLTIKGSCNMTNSMAQCGIVVNSGNLALDGNFTLMGNGYGIVGDRNVFLRGDIKVVSSNVALRCANGTLTIGEGSENITLQGGEDFKVLVAKDFVLGQGLIVSKPFNWGFYPEYNTIGDKDMNITAKYVSITSLGFRLYGDGTVSDPYQIYDADDWYDFAVNTRNGAETSGKYFELQDDITISNITSHSEYPFSGTFDGQGHTLTLNVNASGEGAALFSYISGATIRNLKTDGYIVSLGAYCSGLVGYALDGTNLIENCVIGTRVAAGSSYAGGVLGYVKKGPYVTLDGCVFTGDVYNSGTMTGALRGATLVGYLEPGNQLAMRYCLDASTSNKPTGRGYWPMRSDNVYHTTAGKTDYNDSDNSWRSGEKNVTAFDTKPSGIGSVVKEYGLMTAYTNGIFYDGKYYMYDDGTNGISDVTIGNEPGVWYLPNGTMLDGEPTQPGLYFKERQTYYLK